METKPKSKSSKNCRGMSFPKLATWFRVSRKIHEDVRRGFYQSKLGNKGKVHVAITEIHKTYSQKGRPPFPFDQKASLSPFHMRFPNVGHTVVTKACKTLLSHVSS